MSLLIPTKRATLIGGNNDLLRDDFSGSTISTKWTVVDTESKLSVSGGNLVCGGGKATPGYGDPGLNSKLAVARRAGVRLKWRGQAGQTNALATFVAFSRNATLSSATHWEHGFRFQNDGIIRALINNASVVLPFGYSANTWYWFIITLLSTGAKQYISTDGITFDCIWVEDTYTTTPLYVAPHWYDGAGKLDSIELSVKSVKPPSMSVTPAASTMTYEVELVTNGNMETGDPPTGWTAANATPDGVADERSDGSGVQSLSLTNTASQGNASRSITTVLGRWYAYDGWIKNMVGTGGGRLELFGVTPAVTSASWTKVTGVGRATGTSATYYAQNLGTNVNDAVRYDDLSAVQATLSAMHTHTVDVGKKNGVYRCHPTASAGSPQGMAICVDDETNPQWELQVFTDGTNVVLATWESGVGAAALIDTATGVTYVAGRELRAVVNGTQVAIYYESAAGVFTQIGTTQTITNIASYGTKAAGLDPAGAGNCGLVEVDN